MNLSKRLSLALLALCPAAAMTTSASADWWILFDPLGAIVVGNPADLPEEGNKSFTGETPPSSRSSRPGARRTRWRTSTAAAWSVSSS